MVPSRGQELSKPLAAKPPENGLARSKKPLLPEMDLKEPKPITRGNGTPQETRPSEKIVTKSGEARLPEKASAETLKVHKLANRTSEPSRESKTPNSKLIRPAQSRPQDRETAKPQASVPLARSQGQFVTTERKSIEKARTLTPPVRTIKQPVEYKSVERAADRSTVIERSNLKTGESQPRVRETARPGYSTPQRRLPKFGMNG